MLPNPSFRNCNMQEFEEGEIVEEGEDVVEETQHVYASFNHPSSLACPLYFCHA